MHADDYSQKSFWDYSIHIYYKENVADTFLQIQDNYGADVNMLLFCCWTGITRGVFTEDVFNRAFDFSATWGQGVVKPLRAVRTWMKTAGCHLDEIDTGTCMAYRERVKGIEFQAERLQQDTLEALYANFPVLSLSVEEQLPAITVNIKRYLQSTGSVIDDRLNILLELIIKVSIPGADLSAIREALSE